MECSKTNKYDLSQRQNAALTAFLEQGNRSLNDRLAMQLVALWWEEEDLWIIYRNWQRPERNLGVRIRITEVPENIAQEFYSLREPSSPGWYDNERNLWWQARDERPKTWPPQIIEAIEKTKNLRQLRPHMLWLGDEFLPNHSANTKS